MNKRYLNLLPWRNTRHRQRCYRLYGQVSLLIGAGIILWLGSNFVFQLQETERSLQHSRLQQIKNDYAKTVRNITEIRQNYSPQGQQPAISTTHTLELLDRVAALPLAQGEITMLHFLASEQENARLILQGAVENQQEFEDLHQYLTAQSLFQQVTLENFAPQADGKLKFGFNLLINLEK